MSYLSDDLGCEATYPVEEAFGGDARKVELMCETHMQRNPLSNVLHQGARHRRADAMAWLKFVELIDRGAVLLFTMPTPDWASKDRDVAGNCVSLGHLHAVIHRPSSKGADGELRLPAGIRGVRLTINGPMISYGGHVTLKRSVEMPLEIGSTTAAKSVLNLHIGQTLARFPYRIVGMEPSVFAVLNLERPPTL